MPNKSECGNITLWALMAFLIVTILLGGMAIVPSSLSMTAKHADLVQAQYAAEAGVKRVVATCNAYNAGVSANWSWLNIPQNDIANASYRVVIVDNSTGIPASWGTGITSGIYRVTSVGTVNNSRKQVVALLDININQILTGNFPNVTMYSNGNINSDRGFTINTNGMPVQAAGTITTNITTSPPADKKPNLTLTLPQLDFNSYINSNPNPTQFSIPSNQNCYLTDSDGNYYYDGDLMLKLTSNLNIFGRSDKKGSILFVNGDLTIDASSASLNFNNPIMIVAIGNITIKGTSGVDLVVFAMKDEEGNGGNVIIDSTNWNGGTILAEGNIDFMNMQNCNSKQDLIGIFMNKFNQMNQNNPSIVTCNIERWSDK